MLRLTRVKNVGIPEIHEYFLEACFAQKNERYANMPMQRFRDLLINKIPQLDLDTDEPLPFAFPPIAYRLEQYLARHVYQWTELKNYPACNMVQRLQDTAGTFLCVCVLCCPFSGFHY